MTPTSQFDACHTDLVQKKIEQFTQQEGRRPRMLISSMSSKKLDEKTLHIAQSLAELGFDIDIGPTNQTIEQITLMAVENDAHFICLIHSDQAPFNLLERVRIALKERGSEEIGVVGQGNLSRTDGNRLIQAGFAEFFTPDRPIIETVNGLLDSL